MDLPKLIDELERLRGEAANYGHTLADRELSQRLRRCAIEERLRAGVRNEDGSWAVVPMPKTEAERAAKCDPEYLQAEHATMDIEHEWAMVLAKAEATAYRIQLGIADLQSEFLTPGRAVA